MSGIDFPFGRSVPPSSLLIHLVGANTGFDSPSIRNVCYDGLLRVEQHLQQMAARQHAFFQESTIAAPVLAYFAHTEEVPVFSDCEISIFLFDGLKAHHLCKLGDEVGKDRFGQAQPHSFKLLHLKNIFVFDFLQLKVITFGK